MFFCLVDSVTIPIKPWLQEKGLFVPWSVECLLCREPETVEHNFLEFWDAVFLWDILQRTLKNDLPIITFGICFLSIKKKHERSVPYDMFMLSGLHSLWRTRMALRHADVTFRQARDYFFESVVHVKDVYGTLSEQLEWAPVLDRSVALRPF